MCEKFKPYWLYFAGPDGEAPGKVGAVDCTSQRDICQSMGVNAYPTMKAFHNGAWSDGPFVFSVPELQAWANGVVGAPAPNAFMNTTMYDLLMPKAEVSVENPKPCPADA